MEKHKYLSVFTKHITVDINSHIFFLMEKHKYLFVFTKHITVDINSHIFL